MERLGLNFQFIALQKKNEIYDIEIAINFYYKKIVVCFLSKE